MNQKGYFTQKLGETAKLTYYIKYERLCLTSFPTPKKLNIRRTAYNFFRTYVKTVSEVFDILPNGN